MGGVRNSPFSSRGRESQFRTRRGTEVLSSDHGGAPCAGGDRSEEACYGRKGGTGMGGVGYREGGPPSSRVTQQQRWHAAARVRWRCVQSGRSGMRLQCAAKYNHEGAACGAVQLERWKKGTTLLYLFFLTYIRRWRLCGRAMSGSFLIVLLQEAHLCANNSLTAVG